MPTKEERSLREALAVVTMPLLAHMSKAMSTPVGVLLPLIMGEFKITPTLAAVFMTSRSITTGPVMSVGGYVSDRVGWKVPLVSGLALFFTSVLMLGFAPSYSSLLVVMPLIGLGYAISHPCFYTLLGSILPTSRGLMLGIATLVFYLGGSIGPSLAGILASEGDWRLPFRLFGAIGLIIVFVLALQMRLVKAKVDVGPKRSAGGWTSYRSVLRNRSVLVTTLAHATGSFTYENIIRWTPLLLIPVLDLKGIGFAMGLFQLMGALGCLILGYVSDRLDRRIVYFVSMALACALSLILYLNAYQLTFLTLAILLSATGFLVCPFYSLCMSLLQDNVEKNEIGTATGFTQTVTYSRGIVDSILVGMLIEYVGISQALIYVIPPPILISGILLLLVRKRTITQAQREAHT